MIETQQFKPGEIIIEENDPGETACIIMKGRVRVSRQQGAKTILLCELAAGDIFGEMSMIDERPRCATVKALEATEVHVIHRDKFLVALKQEDDLAVKLLSVLFERLRNANTLIMQFEGDGAGEVLSADRLRYAPAGNTDIRVTIEGLTRGARKSMPENPLLITRFPFNIGRKSRDPLVYNDFEIKDKPPYRVSRHHLQIDKYSDRLLVADRGSHLGFFVNDCYVGGPSHNPGPVDVDGNQATIILGDRHSPYRYRVIAEPLKTKAGSPAH